jgi:predicted SAM-dependent methyltransferase
MPCSGSPSLTVIGETLITWPRSHQPRDGHKVVFTIDNLVPLLESVGFQVTPLEYFDANEEFHARPWDEREGHIKRSIRFDDQVAFKRGEMYYTSIIVDARKGS